MKGDLQERYSAWAYRCRYWLMGLSLLLTVGVGFGLGGLAFKNDYRYFFDKNDPLLQQTDAFQQVYEKNDNILIAIHPKDGDVFSSETLAIVAEVTREAWKIPYAIRVDSLSNFQNSRGRDDDLVVTDLFEGAEGLSTEDLAEIKKVALSEPLLVNRLISSDGRVAGVNASLQLPRTGSMEEVEAVEHARGFVDRINREHPDIELYLTGMVVQNHALMEAVMVDAHTLIPLMFGGILLCAVIILQSWAGALTTLAVITMSNVFALGVAGFLRIPMTPPSAVAPTMIMTLAVADCMHILMGYFQAMRKGLGSRESIVQSVRLNMKPVLITSLTTAIGFLSMMASDSPPLQDLGLITAVGVTFACVLSLTFFPAVVAIGRFRPRRMATVDWRWLEKLAVFCCRRKLRVLLFSTFIVISGAYLISHNELNDTWVKYYSPEIRFRADTDFITSNMTGIYQVEYSIPSKGPQGISDPEYLATMEEFTNWFRQQPSVKHVACITDILKRLNRNLHSENPGEYRIPESQELAAQYLLLYEMSLPFGLSLNNQINLDKSTSRFTATLGDVSSSELKQIAQRGELWLEEHAPSYMHAKAVGDALMFSNLSERNIHSMIGGTIWAFVLVSAVLIVAFRSVGFGLLSLVPNMIPAVVSFGLWGVLVGEVNMAISVVASLTLGIVVDDTVHMMSKFLYARKRLGMNAEEALKYMMTEVGVAVMGTTVILLTGFAVLSCSSFYVNAGMGRLSALTIFIALIADLTLLPVLIVEADDISRRYRALVQRVVRNHEVKGQKLLEKGAD